MSSQAIKNSGCLSVFFLAEEDLETADLARRIKEIFPKTGFSKMFMENEGKRNNTTNKEHYSIITSWIRISVLQGFECLHEFMFFHRINNIFRILE